MGLALSYPDPVFHIQQGQNPRSYRINTQISITISGGFNSLLLLSVLNVGWFIINHIPPNRINTQFSITISGRFNSLLLLSVLNVGWFIINHIPPNRLQHDGMLTELSLCSWRKVNTTCFLYDARACVVQDVCHAPHSAASDGDIQ